MNGKKLEFNTWKIKVEHSKKQKTGCTFFSVIKTNDSDAPNWKYLLSLSRGLFRWPNKDDQIWLCKMTELYCKMTE